MGTAEQEIRLQARIKRGRRLCNKPTAEPRAGAPGALMDRLTRYDWPSDGWDHIECRVSESYQWAMTCPPFKLSERPQAQLQPGEKKQTQEAEDQERVDLVVTDPHRRS